MPSRAMMYVVMTLMAGCSTTWHHSSKPSGAFERDRYECEKDAAPQQDPILWRGMMERCLKLKGWRQG